jgi:hypothetical protein
MIKERQRRCFQAGVHRHAPQIRTAILHLAAAYDDACEMPSDAWEFAVEIESLLELGLTIGDLCGLVERGYAEHAREVTRYEDTTRRFAPSRGLRFAKRTCFVITAAGLGLTAYIGDQTALRRAA